MTLTTTPPCLPAYKHPNGQVFVWCSYCRRYHWHTPKGESYGGHRLCHCFDWDGPGPERKMKDSPYYLTGYVLVESGDMTPAQWEDMRRDRPRGPQPPIEPRPSLRILTVEAVVAIVAADEERFKREHGLSDVSVIDHSTDGLDDDPPPDSAVFRLIRALPREAMLELRVLRWLGHGDICAEDFQIIVDETRADTPDDDEWLAAFLTGLSDLYKSLRAGLKRLAAASAAYDERMMMQHHGHRSAAADDVPPRENQQPKAADTSSGGCGRQPHR